jgi:hypothetical protein
VSATLHFPVSAPAFSRLSYPYYPCRSRPPDKSNNVTNKAPTRLFGYVTLLRQRNKEDCSFPRSWLTLHKEAMRHCLARHNLQLVALDKLDIPFPPNSAADRPSIMSHQFPTVDEHGRTMASIRSISLPTTTGYTTRRCQRS